LPEEDTDPGAAAAVELAEPQPLEAPAPPARLARFRRGRR